MTAISTEMRARRAAQKALARAVARPRPMPFSQRYGIGRTPAQLRAAAQPHPMEILSGEYEKKCVVWRLNDLMHREDDINTFGVQVVDGTPQPLRPIKWCAADSLFVRLMVITRLDRSRCDEDV